VLTKDKSFYKSLLFLASPIALQNLITFSVGFIDNIMTSSLGDSVMSGVYMANQVQVLFALLIGGIEAGLTVLGSQYKGQGDGETVKKIALTGLRFSLLLGVLLSLLSIFAPRFILSLFTDKEEIIRHGAVYLRIISPTYSLFSISQVLVAYERCLGRSYVGLIASGISLGVNLFFNYVLIYGRLGFPSLEVVGVGIATLISRAVELLLVLAYVLFIDKGGRIKLNELLCFDKKLTMDYLKCALPIILGQAVWAFNIFYGSATMGRLSEEGVVSGLSIANSLHTLSYVVINGMSSAVGIITGRTVGEGRLDKLREYSKTVELLFLAVGILTGGAILLGERLFISLFSVSEAARKVAGSLIKVISVTIIGTSYQLATLFGLVKSGGDVWFVTRNDLLFLLFFTLPTSLVAVRLGLPPYAVYLTLKADQLLKCPVARLKLKKFDFVKRLTKEKG